MDTSIDHTDDGFEDDLEAFCEKKYRKYQKKIAKLQAMSGGSVEQEKCVDNGLVTVKFNGKQFKQGESLNLANVQSPPEISFQKPFKSLYTMIMVDPDVPSATDPNKRNHLHWMKINMTDTDEIEFIKFAPSNPPKGSGFHRYFFKIYKQTKPLDQTKIFQYDNSNIQFNPEDFVRLGMELIGCTYYRTKRD